MSDAPRPFPPAPPPSGGGPSGQPPSAMLPPPPPPPPPPHLPAPSQAPPPPPHLGGPGSFNSPIPPAPMVQRPPRTGRALLFGLAAALVAGIVWYAIVVLSDRQFVYLAIGFGVIVGIAVVHGAGRAGPRTIVLSLLIAAVGIVMSYYFINRHAIIEALNDEGGFESVPLFGSFRQVREIVRLGYEEEPTQALFSVIAVVAAGVSGAKAR